MSKMIFLNIVKLGQLNKTKQKILERPSLTHILKLQLSFGIG